MSMSNKPDTEEKGGQNARPAKGTMESGVPV
jgi:hypothetical protein